MTRSASLGLFILLSGIFVLNAQDIPQEPRQSIELLLDKFQKAAVAGTPVDSFFSPDVRARQASQIHALDTKPFLTFQITDFSWKELEQQDADHAALPVTVSYSTRNEGGSRSATLHFVRIQGAWYFADADFWDVSWFWIFPIVMYGAAYGSGVVFMFWHSNRQHWDNLSEKRLWAVLSFLPSSLLFYWIRKPWKTMQPAMQH